MRQSPLDELNERALYQILGDAWYAQLKTEKGGSYFLPSSVEVGKREFDTVAPILRAALREPSFQDVSARIASAHQVEASWQMPATVVAAIARHRGIVTPLDWD